MWFIVIGLVSLITVGNLIWLLAQCAKSDDVDETRAKYFKGKLPKISLLAVAGLFVIGCCAYTVEQGDRAVVLRFGHLYNVTEPGLNFKLPFVDSVRDVSVRTRKMNGKLPVYSKDVQAADIELSVNYSLASASVGDIFTKYGEAYEERILFPQIQAKSKNAFGQLAAVEIVQAREGLARRILEDMQSHFEGTGFRIESVQVENIDFSTEFEKSVERRMKAEIEVAESKQNLEREKINADMVRTKAQGEADAKVAQAKANAEAITLVGEAEAKAIQAKQKALADNPSYVALIQAEKWNGELPGTMIPNGALPIIGK